MAKFLKAPVEEGSHDTGLGALGATAADLDLSMIGGLPGLIGLGVLALIGVMVYCAPDLWDDKPPNDGGGGGWFGDGDCGGD